MSASLHVAIPAICEMNQAMDTRFPINFLSGEEMTPRAVWHQLCFRADEIDPIISNPKNTLFRFGFIIKNRSKNAKEKFKAKKSARILNPSANQLGLDIRTIKVTSAILKFLEQKMGYQTSDSKKNFSEEADQISESTA